MAVILRTYDIRGIVGKTLTKERVYNIGRALGTDAKNHDCKTIVADGENFRFMESLFAEANFPGGKISTIDGLGRFFERLGTSAGVKYKTITGYSL